MKKLLVVAAILACIVFAYVAAGPYIALHGIREGLASSDAGKLGQHIDFPSLRDSMKAQLSARMMAEMSKAEGDEPMAAGFAAMGMMFANNMVEGMIDNLLTPSGIATLTASRGNSNDDAEHETAMDDVEIEYSGFSRAIVTSRHNPDLKLILSRQGTSWRLTDIVFPVD